MVEGPLQAGLQVGEVDEAPSGVPVARLSVGAPVTATDSLKTTCTGITAPVEYEPLAAAAVTLVTVGAAPSTVTAPVIVKFCDCCVQSPLRYAHRYTLNVPAVAGAVIEIVTVCGLVVASVVSMQPVNAPPVVAILHAVARHVCGWPPPASVVVIDAEIVPPGLMVTGVPFELVPPPAPVYGVPPARLTDHVAPHASVNVVCARERESTR